MAHPTPELVELARGFVCARVTDLRDVDLARWRFDFDLTFAALSATPDGVVLHRYGGRDAHDPQAALSMASFVAFVKRSLDETQAAAAPSGDAPAPSDHANAPSRRTISDLPLFRQRDAEQRVECVHCHTVNDFECRQAQADGTWRREQMWVFPDPARLGLEVERDDQQRIARVVTDGPAATAGVHAGDRVVSAAGAAIATRADLQWVLDRLPAGATTLPLVLARDGATLSATLDLADGWKAADAREYAWHPMKWNVGPHPGFGGKLLSTEEKAARGLPAAAFALSITYLVTWGENARCGRNAQQAGLAKGDVLLSIGGRSDFENEEQLQAWFRIALHPGERVAIELMRDGTRRQVKLPVIE